MTFVSQIYDFFQDFFLCLEDFGKQRIILASASTTCDLRLTIYEAYALLSKR